MLSAFDAACAAILPNDVYDISDLHAHAHTHTHTHTHTQDAHVHCTPSKRMPSARAYKMQGDGLRCLKCQRQKKHPKHIDMFRRP